MGELFTALVLCAAGAEKTAANELRKLNLKILDTAYGRVRFTGDLAALYRCLMGLRTADRLLLECASFHAEDFGVLFDGIKEVPWEDYIPRGMGLRVAKVRSNRSALSALTSIQAMVHKAAADRLCTAHGIGRLPEDDAGAELRVFVEKNTVSVYLDLSGEALFRRGYRSEGGAAPIRESTAAALLLLAGWKRKFPLYDPFCGSGTIIAEAALYAWDAAPGTGRSFTLSSLLIGDPHLEGRVRKELLERTDFNRTIRIFGSDTDRRAVSLARSNIQRAYELAQGKTPGRGIRTSVSLPWMPDIKVLPMKEARSPADGGFIITNPPYGKRLGDLVEAEENYREMEQLFVHFPGWKFGIISDHPGLESHIGRKAETVKEITNGAARSYYYLFEGEGKSNVHSGRA